MMKKSKIIITNFSLLLIVGIVFFAYKSNNLRLPEYKTIDKSKLRLNLAKRLHELWMIGPAEDELLACPKLDKSAPLAYYRCNTDYLECSFNEDIVTNGKVFRGKLIDADKVEFKSDKLSFSYKLEQNCHMVYLPQRFYSEGDKRIEENLWDNLNRHFYVDKFYVTNSEVKKWNNDSKLKDNHNANTSLTVKQKVKYCQDQGKRILEARVFDAASFLYERDPENGYFYKYRTHFTKGRTFLSKNKDLEEKNCFDSYIKGCSKFFEFQNYDNIALSSTGIANVIGSEEEYVLNRFDNRRDYKLSSKNLAMNSIYHQVGFRVDNKNYKGAFRCMLQL